MDDIVSDNAGTVLFLQDVVRLDNTLRVIAYRNGSYTNITSNIRNFLNSDEGISKMNGQNGTWYVMTTKARLFRVDSNGSNASQISLPSDIQNQLVYPSSSLLYNVNSGSPAAGSRYVILNLVPIANGNWLLVADPASSTGTHPSRFYRFDGSTFTDITSTIGWSKYNVLKVTSNGTTAIVSMLSYDGVPTTYFTDGLTSSRVSIGGNADLTNAVIGWNGTSWMVVNGKDLYHIAGTYPTNATADQYGRTNDLILSIAGDANGNFLLGGALSQQGSNDPSNPLTAKLIKVIEDGGTSDGTSNSTVTTGGSFGGDRVFTSTNGPRVTIQGNPSGFRVKDGGEFAYRATASDTNGVDRIDLYVNDTRITTCKADVCEYRTTYYVKNATTRTMKFWVRATDKNGNTTDTSGNPDTLTVDVNSNATADGAITNTSTNSTQSNTGSGITTWEWLDPNVTSFNGGDSLSYNVGAWDANGIKQIEIIANGSSKQTCNLNNATGNQQCSATLYANDFAANTSMFVNAKVTDGKGNVAWTAGKNIYRNGTTGSTSGNTNASVWESFSPDVTSLGANQTLSYQANAQDNDGVSRIDIYAKGAIKQTCNLGNTTGNTSCSTTIFANDYAANSNVFVNAKVTDGNGNVTWTGGRTINVTSSSTNSNNTNTSVSESFSPDKTSFNANDYAANTNVFVNAKVTDGNGNVTWTSGRTIFKNGTGSNVSNQSNVETNRWIWLDPDQTAFTTNGQITFNVGAQDGNGISRIDIYANGSIKQTCNLGNSTSNVTCSATIRANDYAQNADIFVNAKVTDAFGNIAWTDSRTLHRNADTSTPTQTTQNGTISAWEWLDPNTASIGQNASVTYHAAAWASAGVNTIAVYVNGNALQSCQLGNAFGNVECTKMLNGSDYAIGSSVFVNAKVTDANGKVAWTAGRTFNVTALSSSNAITLPSQAFVMNASNAFTSISANRSSYAPNDQITYTANASDPDGVQRIEVWLNAERVQTCNSSTCTVTTSKYTSYPWIQFHIVAYDKNGNFSSSPTMTIWKK